MNVSFDTLTLAIKAILLDIERHEALSATDDDEDAEYHGQYVLDLQRALSELGGVYRQARQRYPDSPTLDELVGGG